MNFCTRKRLTTLHSEFLAALHLHQHLARTCVFMGYLTNMKAYKLYDLHTKQFFISRDVIFHEQVFPFHSINPTTTIIDLFPDLVLTSSSLEVYSSQQSSENHFHQDNLNPSPSNRVSESPSPIQPLHTPASIHQNDQPTSPFHHVPLTGSSRLIKPPSYLREFHCNLASIQPAHVPSVCTSLYPLSDFISYDFLSPTYKQLILNISSQIEPQFYHQAMKLPHWHATMKVELDAMELNHTWSVVPLPPDKHLISYKWIYKVKYKSDGSVDRHKARLVSKGYTQ